MEEAIPKYELYRIRGGGWVPWPIGLPEEPLSFGVALRLKLSAENIKTVMIQNRPTAMAAISMEKKKGR